MASSSTAGCLTSSPTLVDLPPTKTLRPFMPRSLFWYNCDGFGDTGWGCGYRCLQTLLSGVDPVPASFADAVTALNGREGVYADIGDIQVLMQGRYGWGASVIMLAVRAEIPYFLLRLERLLHDPSHRHPWVLLAGGGIIVLVSDVDAAGGRLQVFDPHGHPGADDSGMAELATLGKGGFGWVAAEAGLLGCAEPGIAAVMSPDELFMHMSWTALVFDRLPNEPPLPEPPRPPPPPSAYQPQQLWGGAGDGGVPLAWEVGGGGGGGGGSAPGAQWGWDSPPIHPAPSAYPAYQAYYPPPSSAPPRAETAAAYPRASTHGSGGGFPAAARGDVRTVDDLYDEDLAAALAASLRPPAPRR